jgi:hypothetical protein
MMALAKCEFRANAYANIQDFLYFDKNRHVLGFVGFVATNGHDGVANIRRSLVSLDGQCALSTIPNTQPREIFRMCAGTRESAATMSQRAKMFR